MKPKLGNDKHEKKNHYKQIYSKFTISYFQKLTIQ